MIQGVRQVGSLIKKSFDQEPSSPKFKEFLEGRVKPIRTPKTQDVKPLLMEINIDTQKGTIQAMPIVLDNEQAKRYLWIGNADRMNPQDRFTTDKLEYLISKTVPNLYKLLPPESSLKTILSKCFPHFYSNRGYLDPNKLKLNITIPSHSTFKEEIRAVTDAFKKALAIPKEASLYTLLIDGEILSQHPDYHKYLYQTLSGKYFNRSKTGTCHLCGATDKPITWDMAKIRYKWYITQKINFASGVNKGGFYKNYQICETCYDELLQGEGFIDQHLMTRMLETNLYIIPELSEPQKINKEILEKLAKKITEQVNGLGRVKKIREMSDYFEQKQGYHQLTLVFAERPQGNLKVIDVISEVTPSRMHKIMEKVGEANIWAEKYLGRPPYDQSWLNGLEDLMTLLPIHQTGRILQTHPALLMAKHIILGEDIEKLILISDFLECVHAIIHENKSIYAVKQNISKGDPAIFILKALTFLKFLSLLDLIQREPLYKGGKMGMNETPEPYKTVIKELEFDTPKEAMFLLGTLLARIGSAQWKAGSKDKPILGKLNYQGMPLSRVRDFSVDLFDKLRQYEELTGDSEILYSIAKLRLNQTERIWPLSDKENVYYILSGYAYETQRIITAGENKSESKNS